MLLKKYINTDDVSLLSSKIKCGDFHYLPFCVFLIEYEQTT